MNTYYSAPIGKHPDWFWDFLEYHLKHENELLPWLRQCSKKEFRLFQDKFEDEIDPELVDPFDGVFIKSVGGYLSDEAQDDILQWIVVQGKKVWEKAVEEDDKKSECESQERDYDSSIWIQLYEIYEAARKNKESFTENEIVHWNGVSWKPRFASFNVDMVGDIWEERFGDEKKMWFKFWK